jgi:hypothetical protein
MNRLRKGQADRPLADPFRTREKIRVVKPLVCQRRSHGLQLLCVSDQFSKTH